MATSEIITGYRNGIPGRFTRTNWPIAAAAGWRLSKDDEGASEPPMEVTDFLASKRQAPGIETVELEQPEVEKPVKKPVARKPVTRKKK